MTLLDPPLLTKFGKIAVFEEQRTSVRVDNLRNGEHGDELQCRIDQLLCCSSVAHHVDVRVR